MQAARQTTPPRANNNGWTPERRARQSAAIRKWSPWSKSTGPRTPSGKARAAQNAAKPWLARDPDRVMTKAVADQRHYLTELNRFLKMKKLSGQNKLMDRRIKYREKTLAKRGWRVANRLTAALLYANLCKNLAFSRPLPIKVNGNDNDRT